MLLGVVELVVMKLLGLVVQMEVMHLVVMELLMMGLVLTRPPPLPMWKMT